MSLCRCSGDMPPLCAASAVKFLKLKLRYIKVLYGIQMAGAAALIASPMDSNLCVFMCASVSLVWLPSCIAFLSSLRSSVSSSHAFVKVGDCSVQSIHSAYICPHPLTL